MYPYFTPVARCLCESLLGFINPLPPGPVPDSYITGFINPLPPGPVPDSYITGFTPKASATNVHHLLVYGLVIAIFTVCCY